MPKSNLQKALDHYTGVCQQIGLHKDEHEHVFVELQKLEDEKKVAEDALKAVVREKNETIENKYFRVKPSQSFKKWFDFATVKSLVNEAEWSAIEEHALKSVDLDSKKMTELVMEGKIRPEIVQESYREKQMTTRVTIAPIA